MTHRKSSAEGPDDASTKVKFTKLFKAIQDLTNIVGQQVHLQ